MTINPIAEIEKRLEENNYRSRELWFMYADALQQAQCRERQMLGRWIYSELAIVSKKKKTSKDIDLTYKLFSEVQQNGRGVSLLAERILICLDFAGLANYRQG